MIHIVASALGIVFGLVFAAAGFFIVIRPRAAALIIERRRTWAMQNRPKMSDAPVRSRIIGCVFVLLGFGFSVSQVYALAFWVARS